MLEAANGSALHASRNFAVAPPVLPQGLAPVKYAFAISRGGFLLSQKTVSVRIPGITPAGVTRYSTADSVEDKIGACPDFPLPILLTAGDCRIEHPPKL